MDEKHSVTGGYCEPAPVGANDDPLGLLPGTVNGPPLPVLAVAGEEVSAVGSDGIAPKVGETLSVGTAAAELTPRLPISVDPNGIPVRATPPGVVGADDAARLLPPAPHMPDNPDVSTPEVGIPAVAGVPSAMAVPPPSKVAVDPNMVEGDVPAVEHIVPLPGIASAPVDAIRAGLIPGDASSVDPSGMPVGEIAKSVAVPSGEVAPMVGVGVAIAPTCASAMLQLRSAGMAAAANPNPVGILQIALANLVVWRGMVNLALMRRSLPLPDK
jgi:hypothetical protein